MSLGNGMSCGKMDSMSCGKMDSKLRLTSSQDLVHMILHYYVN